LSEADLLLLRTLRDFSYEPAGMTQDKWGAATTWLNNGTCGARHHLPGNSDQLPVFLCLLD
jgi:hypothetical protein